MRNDLVQLLNGEGVYRLLLAPVFKRDDTEHEIVRIRVWTTKAGSIDTHGVVLALCRLIYSDTLDCSSTA